MSRGPTPAVPAETRAKIPRLVAEIGAHATAERLGLRLRLVRDIYRAAVRAAAGTSAPISGTSPPIDGGSR